MDHGGRLVETDRHFKGLRLQQIRGIRMSECSSCFHLKDKYVVLFNFRDMQRHRRCICHASPTSQLKVRFRVEVHRHSREWHNLGSQNGGTPLCVPK